MQGGAGRTVVGRTNCLADGPPHKGGALYKESSLLKNER